jgi:hypothetical protein
LGGPIIGDFNADSLLDILIPVCDYWPHVTHFVALTYKDENWRWVNVLLDMNVIFNLIFRSDLIRKKKLRVPILSHQATKRE